MSRSREDSPDWLRSYQAPTYSPLTLSSNSQSLLDDSPSVELTGNDEEVSTKSLESPESENRQTQTSGSQEEKVVVYRSSKTSKANSVKPKEKASPRKKKVGTPPKRKGDGGKNEGTSGVELDKHCKPKEPIHSIWTISSDSESNQDDCPKKMHSDAVVSTELPKSGLQEDDATINVIKGKSPSKKTSKEKHSGIKEEVENHTPTKTKKKEGSVKITGNDEDMGLAEEGASDKHAEPKLSASSLPLVLSEKVHRAKALIECEGDSIDLSGDVGVVGRIVISDGPSANQEMYLDLKGTIYKTAIIPSRTFCVVSFNQSEAKVEAIMNDFIQLKPQSNVYEAETMVEGTLDGFSFDSEDETDKIPKVSTHQGEQDELIEDQKNGKSKRKAEKTLGGGRKRGKNAGGKHQPPKKAKRKTPTSKKAKTKK